ncbi:rare lipoprotein A [Flavobacterium sp. PL11]|jgi:rare lipoprotein A|uniref:septal ring lytic transglycosylase RlpA family protein n=1 Tax=Flavobacterium sp. PL11 TaxID=3071717 RepID=UPI002DF82B25|nr:rare lipoprotein A [Flavobacterium sp. PL11]
MKRLITTLFLFAFISTVLGQSVVINSQKSTSSKVAVLKPSTEKITIENDSITKIKIALEFQQRKLDSVGNVLAVFKPYKKSVHASYYAAKFTGKKTTSGTRFDNNKYTAAHKKLPFGTKVRVTNEKNGKSVVVEITDRGPYVKAREIDLTKRAFMDIATNKGSGGMIVTIEVMTN